MKGEIYGKAMWMVVMAVGCMLAVGVGTGILIGSEGKLVGSELVWGPGVFWVFGLVFFVALVKAIWDFGRCVEDLPLTETRAGLGSEGLE